jgi:hypothetical protein
MGPTALPPRRAGGDGRNGEGLAMPLTDRRWTRTGAAIAILAVFALTACTSNPVAAPPVESTAPAAPVETPIAEAVPTPTPPAGIPVDLSCDQLVTADELAAFDPGFAPDPGYTAPEGSVASEIVASQGVSCGWLNAATGETIDASVAHLEAADIEARKNQLVTVSKIVPTYAGISDEGYFVQEDGTGRVDLFVGEFWVNADSTYFFEPGDAEPFVSAIAAALR